jgi:UDP-GlcNAc:undecaprenyl-phosphate GlcNAc-1-phosphate transferase
VHHRLLAVGFDHYETVVVIYLIQAAFVVSAVLVRYESDAIVTLIYAAGISVLFWTLASAERHHWRVPRGGFESRFTRAIDVLKRSRVVVNGPLLVITILTPIVMLISALWVTRVPSDFAVTAAVLAVLPATQLLWPQAMRAVVLRVAVYATAIFPAYLLISYPEAIPQRAQFLIIAVIIVLALSVVMYVRFSAEQRFGTTPTDYLIVCGVVALSVFGSIEVNSREVVEAVLLATVLSYACEIIVGAAPQSTGRRLLQCSSLGTLLIIALRGAF